MATKISWCDETINPVVGCSKASEGCRNCYAEKMARRLACMGLPQYQQVIQRDGADYSKFASSWNGHTAFVPSELEKPYKWRKPRTVFISSMGDLFHASVPLAWIDDVMKMVANNSQHTFIVLTKRPQGVKRYFDLIEREFVAELTAYYQLSHGTDPHDLSANWPLPNLIIGVSVEDQQTAAERIPVLMQVPAVKRFISLEPMLGPVDLNPYLFGGLFADPSEIGKFYQPLDGVILGGESDSKGRRLDPQWVMTVRDQCAAAGVPFMFKQWNHENRNEVDPVSGFPFLQNGRTHSKLAWALRGITADGRVDHAI